MKTTLKMINRMQADGIIGNFEHKYLGSNHGQKRDRERRKRLASLPFSEKLKILEKVRDRSRAIAPQRA